MLSIAAHLISNESEAETILSLLENSQLSEYQQESALRIKLHIVRKTKGDEEAEKLIDMNLSYPSFRHDAITKAMDAKNYERAIELAQEGIRKDSKDKPGLATDWKAVSYTHLDVYKRQGLACCQSNNLPSDRSNFALQRINLRDQQCSWKLFGIHSTSLQSALCRLPGSNNLPAV